MKFVDTDILVIGAGAAGLFAAIRATEFTKDVTLLEKATLRSGGNLAIGHYEGDINPMTNIPGGPTRKQFAEMYLTSSSGLTGVENPMDKYIIAEEIVDRVKDLEDWGMKIICKEDGTWATRWNYKIGERMESGISIYGSTLKPALVNQLRKRKVKVIERTMAVDLLTYDGSVVGAVALNTRTGEVTAFRAKATVLATGSTSRSFIVLPGRNWFWMRDMMTNTGDGHGMAYRAGADMTLMEFLRTDHMFCNVMANTYGGVCRNALGEAFLEESYKKLQSRVWAMQWEFLQGRGPCYWDATGLTEEELKHREWNLKEKSLPDTMCKSAYEERGLDPRKDFGEIRMMPIGLLGGPDYDEKAATTLKGLYAAGDLCWMDSMSNAFVFGYRAGEYAAKHALESEPPIVDEEQAKAIEDAIQVYTKRKDGISSLELEEKVRSIMTYYVGYHKTGGMLKRGLELLLEMKEKFLPKVYARNPHELMRAVELRNIFDVAEMHIRSSLMRNESRTGGRHFHHRLDYPDPDPEWYRQRIAIRREDGEMKLFKRLAPPQELPESLKEEE
jgi:succinate dehydrogenase/fumarate reductase flavoprotein subunit